MSTEQGDKIIEMHTQGTQNLTDSNISDIVSDVKKTQMTHQTEKDLLKNRKGNTKSTVSTRPIVTPRNEEAT